MSSPSSHDHGAVRQDKSDRDLEYAIALRSAAQTFVGEGKGGGVTDGLLKALFQSVGDGVVMLDPSGEVMFVNAEAQRLLGYAEEKLLGKNWTESITLFEDERDKPIPLAMRPAHLALANKRTESFIGYYIKKNEAAALPISLVVSPIILNGEAIGTVSLFRDITQDVERSRDMQKFQLALDNASDPIIITDTSGKIVYANPAIRDTTGYARSEILGKTPKLWGGQMPHEFYERMWHRISKERKPFVSEITNKRKNGERYFAMVSISPVFDSSGHIIFYIGLERDITKAKEIDRAKTEFVSLASHQLRTPLSAVNWYTEMLLAGDAGDLTHQQKSYLQEIYTGNQRMVDLVDALLNVSRLELGTFMVDPQETDLKEMAQSVLKELQPQIKEKGIVLKEEYAPGLPHFMADQKLMRMILQNLLSNAVKYTPEKGTVGCDIRSLEKGTVGAVEISAPTMAITVYDSGMGIPRHQQEKVFSKLFRADNAREQVAEGTGLGLYIIKAIVDNAGGNVWFSSEENKGTTFFVTFPLSGMKKKEGSRKLE